jgi:type I restriction enzyme S subunit
MSRGRKAKANGTNLNWQQIFSKNVGKYLQYAIIELGKVQNNQTETGADLLEKIKAEKGKNKKEKELLPIKVEEIPYKIPDNWVWCRLGEIAELKSGNQYPLTQSDGGIMYVKVGDMNLEGNEFEITTSSIFFKKESVNERDLILTGSIIFPKRGGAIATNKRRAVLKEPILIDSNTMAVSPSIEISFNYFFQWFSAIDLSLLGTEGVIPQVNNKDLNPILFPVPPLSEQQKIVDFLTDFENDNFKDDGFYFNQKVEQKVIALHEAQLKGFEIANELTHQRSLLKNLRQQLLQDAVQGKLVKNNETGETGQDLLNKIKAEKEQLIKAKKLKKEKELPPIKAEEIPFEIPEDWVWCRGEIVANYIDPQPSHRTPPESYDGIPYIAMSDIRKDGTIDLSSARKVSNATLQEHQNRYKLEDGDFIFGKIGTIGKPVKLTSPFNYTLSANVILIQPRREIIDQDYLFYFLCSPTAEKNLIDNKSTMSYPVFGMGKARNMPIPLPPLITQHRIVEKIKSLMLICDTLEASIQTSTLENEQLLQQVLREALQA